MTLKNISQSLRLENSLIALTVIQLSVIDFIVNCNVYYLIFCISSVALILHLFLPFVVYYIYYPASVLHFQYVPILLLYPSYHNMQACSTRSHFFHTEDTSHRI